MSKEILVTGGAGFIGSNLIERLLKEEPKSKITSLDNYFTGKKSNHHDCVNYIEGDTINAAKIFKSKKFDVVYHFGEYSRIVHSFSDISIVSSSILHGTPVIIELCKLWNAKLIYSASSSKFGNNGKDENLSPYAWMKAKMVEYIINYSKWFNLNYEICYFYNVYGPKQIYTGNYATVVAIFERQYKAGEPLTIVKPGTQKRDFTHVYDIVDGLILVSKQSSNHEWHFRSGKNISIQNLASLFNTDFKYIPEREGERFTSEEFPSDTEDKLNWKPKRDIQNWVNNIL